MKLWLIDWPFISRHSQFVAQKKAVVAAFFSFRQLTEKRNSSSVINIIHTAACKWLRGWLKLISAHSWVVVINVTFFLKLQYFFSFSFFSINCWESACNFNCCQLNAWQFLSQPPSLKETFTHDLKCKLLQSQMLLPYYLIHFNIVQNIITHITSFIDF